MGLTQMNSVMRLLATAGVLMIKVLNLKEQEFGALLNAAFKVWQNDIQFLSFTHSPHCRN